VIGMLDNSEEEEADDSVDDDAEEVKMAASLSMFEEQLLTTTRAEGLRLLRGGTTKLRLLYLMGSADISTLTDI